MNHIFICTTSYHIMVCHAAAQLIKKFDPEGQYTLIATYNAIHSIELCDKEEWDQLERIQTSDIKPWSIRARKVLLTRGEHIKYKSNPRVYICNDFAWRVQVFARTLTDQENIMILEDGLAAYREKKTKFTHWLYQNIFLRAVHGRNIFNYKGVNRTRARSYFSVRQGSFSWVLDRKKVTQISKEFTDEVSRMSKLITDKPSEVVILTQPLTESLVTSLKQENQIWKAIATAMTVGVDKVITVKRHPRETDTLHKKRVEIIEEMSGKKSLQLDKVIPFEAYLPHLKPGSCVASHSSTALYNGAEIRPDVHFYEIKIDPKHGITLSTITSHRHSGQNEVAPK